MVKKAMNGWGPKRNGYEFTVVTDEICSLPHDSQGGPKLSDGGERRIVDRWGHKRK